MPGFAASPAGYRPVSVIAATGDNYDSQWSSTPGTYDSYRRRFRNQTGTRVTHVRLVYGAYYKSSNTEAAIGNAISVRCSLQHKGTTNDDQTKRRYPLSLDGARTMTVADGDLLVTDWLPFALNVDEDFFVYSAVTAVAGGADKRPAAPRDVVGGTSGGGLNNGEGSLTGTDCTLSTNVNVGEANGAFGPMVVEGLTVDGSVCLSIALMGDSVVEGTGDAGFGRGWGSWAERLFFGLYPDYRYPGVKVAYGSEKLNDWQDITNSWRRRRAMENVTHVMLGYGINDLDLGAGNYATLQSQTTTEVAHWRALGKKVIVATLPPMTNASANGWTVAATVSNRKNESAVNGRIAFNNWVRDGSGAGLDYLSRVAAEVDNPHPGGYAFVDMASQLECDAFGKMKVNGGYLRGYTGALTVSGATAGASSSTTRVTLATAAVADQFRGLTCRLDSSGACSTVWYNDTTDAYLKTAITGMTSGVAYSLYPGPSEDGIHPSYGHRTIAEGLSPKLATLMKVGG